MTRSFLQWFCAIFALHTELFTSLLALPSDTWCPHGFANFGDSLTDTGNALYAFPYYADPENPPYGETFFGRPSKRFSNGRLVPDFFSLAFNKPLLDGYFTPATFDFRAGVNFAVAGAAASRVRTAETPFSTTFQVGQFVRFMRRVNQTRSEQGCGNFLPDLQVPNDYSEWLFTMEFGGNDILTALQGGTPVEQISSSVIPDAISNITAGIQILYEKSARKFLVSGIPAQGCSTVAITVAGSLGPADSFGCVQFVNQMVSAFNRLLFSAIRQLRASLPGVSIAYFDYYGANMEILSNPQIYGFNPEKTLTACCGAPGVSALNYNPVVRCGHPSSNLCSNPSEYVIWDGVHFTDNFYRIISEFLLSGSYTDHGRNYTSNCNLDFSKFGKDATYEEVFGKPQ